MMVHVLSALAFFAVAFGGFAVIAMMLGENLGVIRAALLGQPLDGARVVERRVRVRMRPASYRTMAQIPEARRAA